MKEGSSRHDMALRSIELCAGVGMLGEGARAGLSVFGVGLQTVCYVEREAPAAAQLARLMEAGALDPAPVWSDLTTFDASAWRGCVDIIVAGFPCQDISIAGRRAGLDGKRSGLFFNILDLADDCDAQGLFLENVSAIATATASAVDEAEGDLFERAAARVVGELADRGWDAEWITLSAADVGASHGRARWFCFAWRRMDDTQRIEQPGQRVHAGSWEAWEGASDTHWTGPAVARTTGDRRNEGRPESGWQQGRSDAAQCSGAVANSSQSGLPNSEQQELHGAGGRVEGRAASELRGAPFFAPGPIDPRWADLIAHRPDLAPAVEPGVRMLADGMAYLVDESRAHQLRQVGNGVVPLQASVAFVELVRRSGAMRQSA